MITPESGNVPSLFSRDFSFPFEMEVSPAGEMSEMEKGAFAAGWSKQGCSGGKGRMG